MLIPAGLTNMDSMEFLKRAERYAEARGDKMYFKNLYTGFREYNNVEDSVWKSLTYLYDEDSADLLKYQYWGPAL
jgi:hypothetical protein